MHRLTRTLFAGLLSGLAACAHANDLAPLGDEFDGSAGPGKWRSFHEAYGWPDQILKLDVDQSVPGALHLQPRHSAWVRDLVAPYLFQEVAGNFDVRARVRVRGADSAIPGGTWSLGGLLARMPNRNRADAWEPRRENWMFITTGVGHVRGEPMTETKSTVNSSSSLKLRPFESGWVELRLVRVGMAFIALARADGDTQWSVRDRFYRMDAPPVMQVGLVAYTHSDAVPQEPEDPQRINRTVRENAPVDMLMDVDWVRFARPALRGEPDWYRQVSANPLADPGLGEAAILALLEPATAND